MKHLYFKGAGDDGKEEESNNRDKNEEKGDKEDGKNSIETVRCTVSVIRLQRKKNK